jgi:hypothetical protein
MTDDASPENLRKFLESDDPAMVRMGIAMAKGAGVEITVKDLEHFLKSIFEPLRTLKYYEKLNDTTGFIIAVEAGIGNEVIDMLCEILWHTWPRECVPITIARRHKNDGKRSAANQSLAMEVVKVLGDIGDLRTVEPLIKVLQYHESTNPRSSGHTAYGFPPKKVRKGAADALDKLSWKPETDEQRASYLIAKEDWDALVELGETAAKPLVEAMKWDDGDLIGYGTSGEGGIEETLTRIDDSAVEVLTEALTDEYIKVRKTAAEVLGKIGDARAVEPLIEALEDEEVRKHATRALGEIGDDRAVEPLIKALGDGSYSGLWDGNSTALAALGKIGDARAIEPLIERLKNDYGPVADALKMFGVQGLQGFITAGKEDELTVSELKIILKENKLPISGTKALLIQRIMDAK